VRTPKNMTASKRQPPTCGKRWLILAARERSIRTLDFASVLIKVSLLSAAERTRCRRIPIRVLGNAFKLG
jgi:hypothetical protein